MSFMQRWQITAHGLLRIVFGFLFSCHGGQKLLGIPPGGANGNIPLFSFMGFAGFLELVGGLLLIIGLFTRPVAFLLSGMMATAYFTVHQPQGGLPIMNGGELAALYCFAFFFLSAAGPGCCSIDNLITKSNKTDT